MSESIYRLTMPGGWAAEFTAEQLDLLAKNVASAKAYADRDRQEGRDALEAIRAQSRQDRTDRLHDIVQEIKPSMQCNCDLDAWEPERSTGHSHVCRIHKRALEIYAQEAKP